MSAYDLTHFIDDVGRAARASPEPADCVLAVAPLMHRLLQGDRGFLQPRHFQDDPAHYARNAVHVDQAGGPSLYTLVWSPGQWTPVHDHGTWGVVGVVRGVLEERNHIRTDHNDEADAGIVLKRGGIILLAEGTVTSFVPNPDHIHRTGVPEEREQVVSLHLYGRAMNSFHVYDVEAGTRRLIDVHLTEN